MRKYGLCLLLCVFSLEFVNGQCLGTQSYTLTPGGPYSPGQTVMVTYTLSSFTQVNVNWVHCFDLDLGPGWSTVTPISAPGNPGGSNGSWIWDTQHTYTLPTPNLNFGPGWRFTNTSSPNWGTASIGPFNMSFDREH